MTRRHSRVYDPIKRALDFAAATVGLIVLSPVLAMVAIAVRKNLGSPVIFSQARPGRNGKLFRLHKFRTMKEIDAAKGLVSDAERMTAFGRGLRASSLDELPALINVIRGDMSIVGPRPLLPQYLTRYSHVQARRHEVRPGITGLAQVRGRNFLAWESKFALDVEYVDSRSLLLDFCIVLRTVLTVLRRDGIAADGEATMSEFLGSKASTGGDAR